MHIEDSFFFLQKRLPSESTSFVIHERCKYRLQNKTKNYLCGPYSEAYIARKLIVSYHHSHILPLKHFTMSLKSNDKKLIQNASQKLFMHTNLFLFQTKKRTFKTKTYLSRKERSFQSPILLLLCNVEAQSVYHFFDALTSHETCI